MISFEKEEIAMNERNSERPSPIELVDLVRQQTCDYRPRVSYSGKPIDTITVFRGPHAEEVHAGPPSWINLNDPDNEVWFKTGDNKELKDNLFELILTRGITTQAAESLRDQLYQIGALHAPDSQIIEKNILDWSEGYKQVCADEAAGLLGES
jgi:hypothetical protein